MASPTRWGRPVRRRGSGFTGLLERPGVAGWVFVLPAITILVAFLGVPIVLALYVSGTDWDGLSSPLSGGARWVGLDNYEALLTGEGGLTHLSFATAVRNNFYFVLFTVPLQTILALGLAVLVNDRRLRAKGFFRTAFYFPSVTSSIAITVVFIFLFQGNGAVNRILAAFGSDGPNWLVDTRGVFWQALRPFGVRQQPAWADNEFFGLPLGEWLAGPSVGMCVVIVLCVWTTSGTFMLLFLAALQNMAEELEEAGGLDGASAWQRFRFVTLPMLRPTLALVITLGLIGTWQVFDQIVLTGDNNRSMITPAYLSYTKSFNDSSFGVGAAIAFLLCALIVSMNALQRRVLREDLFT
jgi:multiple sugar transport system permease protein